MFLSKHAKPRLVNRQPKSLREPEKKPTKYLPDASHIPWFPALSKTGTDV
jgi:hypothetical protein